MRKIKYIYANLLTLTAFVPLMALTLLFVAVVAVYSLICPKVDKEPWEIIDTLEDFRRKILQDNNLIN